MGRWAALLCLFAVGASLATTPTSYVPTYSARYGAEDGTLREILLEIKGIRADLGRLSKSGTKTVTTLADFVSTRCAGCHAEAVAPKKGAGFVLLTSAGKVPPLSLAEKRRMIRLVGKGDMPPGAPLADEEKQLLTQLLNSEESP